MRCIGALALAGSALLIGAFPTTSHAVIIYGSTGHDTSTPTGEFANSGYQYEGTFGAYLGTPIAQNYFITAQHIGNYPVNSEFVDYLGVKHYTVEISPGKAYADDAGTDLRIYKVSTPFTSWAPLYTGGNESNLPMTVFGRGTQRGAEYKDAGGTTRGWAWGSGDSAHVSWGFNYVTQTLPGDHYVGFSFSTAIYNYLNNTVGDSYAANHVAIVSGGDSGGGLFVYDNGVWKLAGVNYAVDGPYSLTNGGTVTYASLYNQTGLFEYDTTNHVYIPVDHTAGTSYSSRTYSSLGWIYSQAGVPEPTAIVLFLTGGLLLATRRRKTQDSSGHQMMRDICPTALLVRRGHQA